MSLNILFFYSFLISTSISILFYSILFYSILFYSILFYSTLGLTELSIIYFLVSEKVYLKSQITVTRALNISRTFSHSSIVGFWITHVKKKNKQTNKKNPQISHFGQYLDTRNDQEFTNIETFPDLRLHTVSMFKSLNHWQRFSSLVELTFFFSPRPTVSF